MIKYNNVKYRKSIDDIKQVYLIQNFVMDAPGQLSFIHISLQKPIIPV